MRYDQLYAIRAQKAVDSGLVDLEALIDELRALGMPDERIDAMIMDDLREGGPIFGKFFRSLGMAASDSVAVAHRTANSVATSVGLSEGVQRIASAPRSLGGVTAGLPATAAGKGVVRVPLSDKQLQSMDVGKESLGRLAGPLKVGDIDIVELAREGDPEALEYLEDITDYEALTWVCALRKTCAKCLPLHGKTMTRKDWSASGYHPGALHPRCMCVFEPSIVSASREQHIAPLVRQAAQGQPKGSKRTVRAVAQADVDKARAAAEAAAQTPEGRKLLSQLGSVNEP